MSTPPSLSATTLADPSSSAEGRISPLAEADKGKDKVEGTCLKDEMRPKIFFHLLAIFLFGFAFVSISYVGLPVDFNADHIGTNIRGARTLSYGELIRATLNPLTPAWFYPPDEGGLRRMEYLRPLQFILMKFFFETFDYSLPPVHLFVALGHGILLAVFAVLLFYATGSILWGWLAALLYAGFPSNVFMMISTFSLDFQFYVSTLSIAALFLFGLLTLGKFKSKGSFLLGILGWVIAAWLAIKLKSSEKILPFICLAFLIFRLRFALFRIGRPRVLSLILFLFLTLFLVVPFNSLKGWAPHHPGSVEAVNLEPVSEKDKTTFSFHWKNLIERTFFVPGGRCPFATVSRSKVPHSLGENFGFFLSWFFWVALIVTPFILLRISPLTLTLSPKGRGRKAPWGPRPFTGKGEGEEAFRHFFWLNLIWFGTTLLGFANGLDVRDSRLLNFAYVPASLLLFLMISVLERNLSSSRAKGFFRIAVLSVLLYSSFSNFTLLAKLIGNFGGVQDAVVRAERDVFQATSAREPGLGFYERWHGEMVLAPQTRIVFIDWFDLESNWYQEALEKLNEGETLYFFTRTQDSERLKKFREASLEVSFWKRYDFLEAKPLIFRLFQVVGKFKNIVRTSEKENAILVYQIKGAPQIKAWLFSE